MRRCLERCCLAAILVAALLLIGCGRSDTDPQLKSLGSMEVIAKLVEVPEGAIFQRDLYDYASVLKYQVLSVRRGKLEEGAVIFVGHYNPWKPRAQAADNRVKQVGGTLREFRAGAVHHMALEPSMEDQFMGGVVDKYFGQHTGPTFWALWTDPAK